MSKFTKLTELHLLNAIAKFPDDILRDDTNRAFQLSIAIIAHFFDEKWIADHVSPVSPCPGFLRLILGEGPATQISSFRIVDFAEILLNLQDVPGFDLCIERMAQGNIEPTYAEFDLGRMLYVSDINFRYVEPQQKRQSDFDIEIVLPDGVTVCGDAKCKIEATEFTEATVRNSLDTARKQFPKDRPSIIFVKVPPRWLSEPHIGKSLNEIAREFLRSTQRIVSVKYYVSTIVYNERHLTHDHIFAEISNPNNRFDRNRKWEMFASPRQDGAWNGMPARWKRLLFFPKNGPDS